MIVRYVQTSLFFPRRTASCSSMSIKQALGPNGTCFSGMTHAGLWSSPLCSKSSSSALYSGEKPPPPDHRVERGKWARCWFFPTFSLFIATNRLPIFLSNTAWTCSLNSDSFYFHVFKLYGTFQKCNLVLTAVRINGKHNYSNKQSDSESLPIHCGKVKAGTWGNYSHQTQKQRENKGIHAYCLASFLLSKTVQGQVIHI